ncbi:MULTISPECIES: STAS domain-containing protein [unclassified Streptomyces]|uniref:STAS domain-containing protein n=1 Tax=unclassified Streptomyces TaxID=2593676 RepID=UPI002E78B127|nr:MULTISPECIES: STAS domain-containing protein [unclassified Streptomyces]MEE1757958.1 STAS domain-containing protein [Streptomyces sp. SP18BB07]MEE1832848.1 STAS domain-containing protein [Streptomyces sp. SP17KL33]
MDVPVDAENRSGAPSHGATGLEVYPLPGRAGVRAAGEVNAHTRPAWIEALGQLTQRGEDLVHVDMSQVIFIDVAGVTELAMAAQSLRGGRRIVVQQPPPQVPRVLELFWPGLGGIEVAP